MNTISKNQIALAGEFAVLSQLALQGFDANLTLGNTKGVDILVSHPETDSMFRLEVKTHTRNKYYRNGTFGHIVADWRMGDKHETNRDPRLFYCFVSIADNTQFFDFYIVPSNIVANFVTESHQYWLNEADTRKDNPMRKFMLGKGGENYPVNMPLAETYHGKWDLLK